MTGHPARIDSPNTPPSLSSGVLTPPRQSADDPIPSSPPLPSPSSTSGSYLGSMFTGLIRRFSTEDSHLGSQIDTFFMGPPTTEQQQRLKAAAEYGRSSPSQDDGINGVFQPPVKRTISPFRPPPLDPLVLHGQRDGSAALLTQGIAEEIRTMIPERLRITEDWRIVYSLEQDGASLSTLYQKCRHFEGKRVGFVLVVKDQDGGTFGAYLSEYPHPAPSYFGNGECFLWRASLLASLPPPPSADTTFLTRNTQLAPPPRDAAATSNSNNSNNSLSVSAAGAQISRSPTPSESIRFKAFPYSGLNDFCINCETGFLSVGSGGGHYGLWLDDSLDVGHSSRCETFGNEPLSDEGQKFGVIGVELWAVGT